MPDNVLWQTIFPKLQCWQRLVCSTYELQEFPNQLF